ncbi:glucoamylase family protein [Winogradskyella bathintestinalis]|uniref:Glucoamylase family protein n=1 Tax=Winogradskyella bathintestinalis TaxID=3035208 RepID=A0ABT7ZQ19_9FLAO|nr:glucoamylase family protein [Winogradskyella bathintestinalis]MDN3491126.1 glucoamylase family protein [Winogradskyella bathintestinalis]
MKRSKHIIFLVLIALLYLFVSCNNDNSEKELAHAEFFLQEITYSESKLLDTIQKQTIDYFWEGAEPNSGLARERIHMDNVYPTSPKNTVTTGGSGFGLMAILVGIERGFIPKEEALTRYHKIVDFLENADRFHGAWSHWIDGETGKVYPFSKKDNGGDLVETAFLMQGLLTVAEYFDGDTEKERQLVAKINQLWREVEWDWYTKNGEDVLYWHWSPEYGWEMNFPVGGYNECLIMYVLAAASPTHPISKTVYEEGWAKNGDIVSNKNQYDLDLVLNYYGNHKPEVGPLFWSHYSYLGLNPKGLKDQYADYWKLVQNHAKIQYRYAIDNPKNFKGYGDNLWGLTSSYSVNGYKGHRPGRDLGVISPTAALSSFPYTPKESMNVLENIYKHHDSLVGKFGPYDAFSFEYNWSTPKYLAIDQGPIPVMIENYRTGLLWSLFMKNKDVQSGLDKLGFTYNKIN